MTASSLVRFDIEDAPSDADVEVLPNGLEAFNESKWPGHQQWRGGGGGGGGGGGSRAKPIPAGSSSATSGSATRCGARGLDASSWATPRPVRSSAAAIRPGSTPSVSRPRASIRSSGMRYSANSTIRPDTGEYSSGSTLKQRQAHKFTRANDSSDLTALLRKLFRAGGARSRLRALIGMGDRFERRIGELDLAVISEVEAHHIDGLPDLIEGDVSNKQGRHLRIEAGDFDAHRNRLCAFGEFAVGIEVDANVIMAGRDAPDRRRFLVRFRLRLRAVGERDLRCRIAKTVAI